MKLQKKTHAYNHEINKNIFKKHEGRHTLEMDDQKISVQVHKKKDNSGNTSWINWNDFFSLMYSMFVCIYSKNFYFLTIIICSEHFAFYYIILIIN